MNINDVKELKQKYQQELVERVAGLLGLSAESVMADWSLERTMVSVKLVNNNTITNFVFDWDGAEFVIHTSSYQLAMQGDLPIGITASSAAISLNTIHAIFDAVVDVLNGSTDEDASDGDCEKCAGEKDA